MQIGVRMKQNNDYRWWPKIGKCKKHFFDFDRDLDEIEKRFLMLSEGRTKRK